MIIGDSFYTGGFIICALGKVGMPQEGEGGYTLGGEGGYCSGGEGWYAQ